jgi:hypothetical protein
MKKTIIEQEKKISQLITASKNLNLKIKAILKYLDVSYDAKTASIIDRKKIESNDQLSCSTLDLTGSLFKP